MYEQYRVNELSKQVEFLHMVILFLCGLICIFFIRNLYNLIRKRSFRKKNKQLLLEQTVTDEKLLNQQISIENLNKDIRAQKRENALRESKYVEEVLGLKENNARFEKLLKEQKELSEYQRKALERVADYKAIDANNTRLGAHFIKNVISHVYQNLEIADNAPPSSILGFSRPSKTTDEVKLSIGALKNMFTLLDYNVSAVHKEYVTMEEEIIHLEKFIELLKFLKPKSVITLNKELDIDIIKDLKIKPTLFFPFLENALKHGSLNETNSFIAIHVLCVNGNQLSYQVENSCESVKGQLPVENAKTPFGLNALKKLMMTYYPNSTLTHQIVGINRYVAHLKLTA